VKAASLFAGIGGFDLAAERLGIEVVVQAEINNDAQRVLFTQFPGARIEEDARHVDLAGVDLVMAGFPCQGLSVAASTPRGQGLFDPTSMSSVVWDVLARVASARPRFLLLENADSLNTTRYADDMRALLGAIKGAGYHAHVFSLNAGCYGSMMRRVRTFILCRRDFWLQPLTEGSVVWACEANAIGVSNQQGGAAWCAQPSVTKKSGSYTLMVTRDEVRSLLPEAVEVLFGYPVGWTRAAGSQTARYDRLGNTVSVHAATAALRLLLEGVAPTSVPPQSYHESIYPLTRPASGGAAGSALGRIARTALSARAAGGRNPNTNRVELAYCTPVYEAWMHSHPDEISEAMWGYLAAVKSILPRAIPWPETVAVEMEQR
jgi:DNA (cytosine-5)-methyltransferase 1